MNGLAHSLLKVSLFAFGLFAIAVSTASAQEIELATGQKVTVGARNTACKSGNFAGLSARWKSGKLELESNCSPALCMAFYDREPSSDWFTYGVSVETQPGVHKLYKAGLGKQEAKDLAARLVQQGQCGRTDFTSQMQQAKGGQWKVVR